MKTKALLLAVAAVAMVASAQAQAVYSVNAVGYVNVNIDPGFNMVSNPLTAADNTVQSLFKNFQGTIPGGLKVYYFNAQGGFDTIQWNDLDSVYEPTDLAAQTLLPGSGLFVFNPSQTQLKLTFVGEVPQGPLSNPLPKGFSIKSSQVPQEGKPDALGLPAQGGDKIFRYNKTTKQYDTYTFNDLDSIWENNVGVAGLPTIPVGESFFLLRAQSAGAWTRTFSVNNPT